MKTELIPSITNQSFLKMLDAVISWNPIMTYEVAAKFVIQNKGIYDSEFVEACKQFLLDQSVEG